MKTRKTGLEYYKVVSGQLKEAGLILFIIMCSMTVVQAQQTTASTGGDAKGSGGSISYTVGQTFYNFNLGTNNSVAEGVQQAFEISEITGIDDVKGISLVCSVYPNPTIDVLTLKIDGDIQAGYIAFLYDNSGKLLKNIKIETNETTIPMQDLANSIYYLKIVQTRHASALRFIKTFKIIKN